MTSAEMVSTKRLDGVASKVSVATDDWSCARSTLMHAINSMNGKLKEANEYQRQADLSFDSEQRALQVMMRAIEEFEKERKEACKHHAINVIEGPQG